MRAAIGARRCTAHHVCTALSARTDMAAGHEDMRLLRIHAYHTTIVISGAHGAWHLLLLVTCAFRSSWQLVSLVCNNATSPRALECSLLGRGKVPEVLLFAAGFITESANGFLVFLDDLLQTPLKPALLVLEGTSVRPSCDARATAISTVSAAGGLAAAASTAEPRAPRCRAYTSAASSAVMKWPSEGAFVCLPLAPGP